jgi:RHS repeat-associated protein
MLKTTWRSLLSIAATFACTLASAGTVYYHNDIAGSPIAATNESGAVLWRESYRPYGERLTNAPASEANDIWFTSRRQDVDTGLVYMGARYYDPVIGRFISKDPVGFDEANIHSFNRYAYANNNPNRYVDPDGRSATLTLCFGGPVACVVGVGLTVATAYYGAEAIKGTARALNSYNEQAGGDSASGESPTGESSEGCIYCVKGDKTNSGKDYVGSTDNLDQRQRDKSDGRDRGGAEVVDTYAKGDRDARRAKEQQAINDRGGVDKLDNRRNEIAPAKWDQFGVR